MKLAITLFFSYLAVCSSAFARVVTTEEKGQRLELENSKTIIEVAPHSKLIINEGELPESVTLELGLARVHVQKALDAEKKNNQPKFILKTRAATMGVRGTDFLAIANPVLNEAEIVVFGGNVEFASTTDVRDLKHVPAGTWGGIGGRFGKTTHDLIALSRTAILYFDKISTVKELEQ
jgi:hypothetical protein